MFPEMQETELCSLENSAQIFNALADIPGEMGDVGLLLEASERASADVTEAAIDALRRKHLAYLMADQGALLNPEHARNLPKQVTSIGAYLSYLRWSLRCSEGPFRNLPLTRR